MTLHIYNCETATIRSEMVKRTKHETGEEFYGLRLHMNTDQTVTFWSRTVEQLEQTVQQFVETIKKQPSEQPTIVGQMAR